MLSSETRKAIYKLLTRILENEREIENERKVLIKMIGHKLREIFETIDLNRNGVLSLKEVFLNDNKIKKKINSIYLN